MGPTISEHDRSAFSASRRFGLRRGRLQPGPLNVVPRRRTIAWFIPACLVVALAAAGSATALIAARPAAERVVAEPMASIAVGTIRDGAPETQPIEPASIPAAAETPAPVTQATAPIDRAGVEGPRALTPSPAARETVAVPGPRSAPPKVPEAAFQLSSLPVLEMDEARLGLDQIDLEPAPAVTKPTPRRAAPGRHTPSRAPGASAQIP